MAVLPWEEGLIHLRRLWLRSKLGFSVKARVKLLIYVLERSKPDPYADPTWVEAILWSYEQAYG